MSLPDELRPTLLRTALRVRAQRAIDVGFVLALPGLGIGALTIATLKTGAIDEASCIVWLIGAASLPLFGAILGASLRIKPLLTAKLIDRAHGLSDRVTNAVAFASELERTRFMDAAIEDARGRAATLSAERAMPLRPPRDLWVGASLALGLLFLLLLEVPQYLAPPRASGSGIQAVVLHEDDLDAYESELDDLLADPTTPEDVRSIAQEFNRLIEDLADQRLDREESLRRISDLEQRLEETRPADASLLRDSLEQLGHDMERSDLAEELSAALEAADAERAESEMRQLAERLRTEPPTRAQLDALREALEQARENQPEDRSEEIQQQEEEEQRLLQRQRDGTATEQDRRLLQRRQRELERLRRENQEAMERRRQLDRLQRELQEAAEELEQNDQENAAEDLEQAAEELNRMAQEQLSQQEMEQLQQQLEQLRELIRRQRQQGQGQGQQGQNQRNGQGQGQSQMERFVLRARGQGNGNVIIQGPGQQGQGQPGGQGQEGQDGEGQGQEGQGQGQPGGAGQGQPGQGQGQGDPNGPRVLTLGGDGEPNAILEIPGMGQGQGPGQGQGGMRPGEPGPGAGVGHDPTTLDDPTHLGGDRRNVRVEGQATEGPSRSEVIRGSAERGFANREYENVYTDYSDHAEEVLERDEIPPGYRFYVRRYFQLIRPRE